MRASTGPFWWDRGTFLTWVGRGVARWRDYYVVYFEPRRVEDVIKEVLTQGDGINLLTRTFQTLYLGFN